MVAFFYIFLHKKSFLAKKISMRISSLALSILMVVLSFPSSTCAESVNVDSDFSALGREPTWLRLLHFENVAGEKKSAINSKEFFLSKTGSYDAIAELAATVEAFRAPVASNLNEHARCRFPARFIWIQTKRPELLSGIESIDCESFQRWTKSNSVVSISVVFATGYLGNPASYYGHTLLKLNFEKNDDAGSLLDVSVNYGAIVPKDENSIRYIYNGLMGGYDGGFSHVAFYFHNHNYGDNELRDLWEYRLNLPPTAVAFIVAHAWEVLGRKYAYYFFRQNCAYRMAELLEIVDGINVIPQNRPWTVPQSHIQLLSKVNLNGVKLIDSVKYHPSRQSRFYDRYQSLSELEKELLSSIIASHSTFSSDEYTSLAISRRRIVLDTLLDYYQYVGNPWPQVSPEIKEAYTATLAQRYREPAGRAEIIPSERISPDGGRAPSYMSVGVAQLDGVSDYMTVRIRPAYYDSLDASAGHVQNASLSMGDVLLGVSQSRIYLKRLDVINIESVSPGLSNLPGDRGDLWQLRFGADERRVGCTSCLVARAQGDAGIGKNVTRNQYLFASVGGAIQTRSALDGVGFARVSTGIISNVGESKFKVSIERRVSIGSAMTSSYTVFHFDSRWVIDANSDIRFGYVRDFAQQINIAVGKYW